MQSVQLVPDSIFSAAIRGLIIGIILGLIPLIVGILKKKRSLGIYGLASSAIGGALLSGLFSIIIVPIFVWLILRKPKTKESEEVANTENSSETPVSGD